MTKTFRNLSTAATGRSFTNTNYSMSASGTLGTNIFTGGVFNSGTFNNITIDTVSFRNSVVLYGTNSSNTITFNGQTNFFGIDVPNVNLGPLTRMYYGPTNYITSNSDNRLTLIGANGISLAAQSGAISIPLDCQIEYGNSDQYIRGNSAGELVIGAPQISFAGRTDIPFPYSLTFGLSSTTIYSANLDSDTLVITAPTVDLKATGQINIPTTIPVNFGNSTKLIEEKGILSIESDVVRLAGQTLLKFDHGETIVSTNKGLIMSAPAFTVTGDLYIKGQTIAVDTINIMVDDPVVIVGEGSHTDNFDRGLAFTVPNESYGFMGYKPDIGRFVFYSDTNSSFVPNYFPRGTTGLLECAGIYNMQMLKIDSPSTVFLSSTVFFNQGLTVGIRAPDESTLSITAPTLVIDNTRLTSLRDGTLKLDSSLMISGSKISVDNGAMTIRDVTHLALPSASSVLFGSGYTKISSTGAGGLRISPSLEVGGSITAGEWKASPIGAAYGGIGQVFTIDKAIPYFSSTGSGLFQQSPTFTWSNNTSTLSLGTALQLSPTGLAFTAPLFTLGQMTLRGSWLHWSNNDYIGSPSLGTVVVQAAASIQLNALNGIDTTQSSLKIQKTITMNDNAYIQWSSTSIQNVAGNLNLTAKTISLKTADHVEVTDGYPITWGDGKAIGITGSARTGTLSLMAPTAISIPNGLPLVFTGTNSQIINQTNELQVSADGAVRLKAPLIILDGQTQMTGPTSIITTKTLVVDGSIMKIGDTSTLNYDTGKDLGMQLQYYGGSSYMLWQNASKRFVFVANGTDTDKNDVVEVKQLAEVQMDSVVTNRLSGCTLTGDLRAQSSLISGNNFDIGGGQINNWSTTTTSVITNLNADYVRGKTVSDLVLRDGSMGLINNWNAGCGIDAKFFSFADPNNNSLLIRDQSGKISCTALTYDKTRMTICGNLDVSNSTLTLRDGQIDGTKLTGLAAKLSIGGNAGSVTNGVYTTSYTRAHCILKADEENLPQPCVVEQNSVVGRLNGDIVALTPTNLRDMITPMDAGVRGWELVINSRPSLTKAITYVRVTETTTVVLPDGTPGQTLVIVAALAPGITYSVSLNLTTPDGSTGIKSLTFDKSGMSVHLCYFPGLSWIIINSGVFCDASPSSPGI